MAIYKEERLFTFFDYKWIKNYIFIANSANMPSTKRTLSSKLFIAYYKKTVKKITSYITAKRYLNFTTDETSNIHKE